MLTDEMRAAGRIEHDGGPCPVAPSVRVAVWLRWSDCPESETNVRAANNFDWDHVPDDCGQDIIAYRPEPTP